MDSSVAVVLAIVLGFLLGAGFVWLLHVASVRQAKARAAFSPRLPEGIEHLLGALDSIVIVTDLSRNVYQSSPGATSKGLVRPGGRLDERVGAVVDEARRQGEAVTRDLEIARGPFGRSEIHVRVRAAPLSTRFFLVLAEDRTEALRVESVRRDFVANVSHELKTPIGAVTLLAEAISESAGDEEQVKYFTGRLSKESLRLASITNELIELSRLQSSDSLAHPELISIHEILSLAVDQSRVPAEVGGVEIVLGDDVDAFVYGERAHLLMCFTNLVSNAVQYSSPNSRVGIGTRLVDDTVEVAISDQGIGIAPEDQGRIFERFFRVDQARSRRTGGTGLGLSIVRHVAEKHGGDVRVWSQPGKGSTFTVRLTSADSVVDEIDLQRFTERRSA